MPYMNNPEERKPLEETMEILNELVKSHFDSQTNDNDIPCDESSAEDIIQLIGSQCEEGVLTTKYSSIDLLDHWTYVLCMGPYEELSLAHGKIVCTINSSTKIPLDLELGTSNSSFHGKHGNNGCFF
jgi:hypothetical protein